MSTKKIVVIGIGVAAVGGIAWYLYNKNKNAQAASASASYTADSDPSSTNLPASSGSSSSPASSTPVSVLSTKQTKFKDKDGNTFEMTADHQKWGYTIKVNGQVQGKTNQLVVLVNAPDGTMIGADNNGSVYQYKNGWQYVVKDNKNEADAYLRKLGVTDFLSLKGFNGFRSLSGLPNAAYILN